MIRRGILIGVAVGVTLDLIGVVLALASPDGWAVWRVALACSPLIVIFAALGAAIAMGMGDGRSRWSP